MSANHRSLRSALIVTAFATKTSHGRELVEEERCEAQLGVGEVLRFEGRDSQSATTFATLANAAPAQAHRAHPRRRVLVPVR